MSRPWDRWTDRYGVPLSTRARTALRNFSGPEDVTFRSLWILRGVGAVTLREIARVFAHNGCTPRQEESALPAPRYTVEEYRSIVEALVAWAKTIRRKHYRWDCEACGRDYHPSDGPPPKEKRRKGQPECGHGHWRELHAYWNPETQDYDE